MYSKQEVSVIKRKFWTIFGQYMEPIQSASGEKINWVNYKTGVRNIFFRMQATNYSAVIAIEITHKDPFLRKLFFEKFQETRKMFEEIAGHGWTWRHDHVDEHGMQASRISKELVGVNVLNENDWPVIITFLK